MTPTLVPDKVWITFYDEDSPPYCPSCGTLCSLTAKDEKPYVVGSLVLEEGIVSVTSECDCFPSLVLLAIPRKHGRIL